MSLIGKQAPDFTAKAVIKGEIVDRFSLSDFRGRYVVFSFIRSTLLLFVQRNCTRFKKNYQNLKSAVRN
jgi:Peroxiredoxin